MSGGRRLSESDRRNSAYDDLVERVLGGSISSALSPQFRQLLQAINDTSVDSEPGGDDAHSDASEATPEPPPKSATERARDILQMSGRKECDFPPPPMAPPDILPRFEWAAAAARGVSPVRGALEGLVAPLGSAVGVSPPASISPRGPAPPYVAPPDDAPPVLPRATGPARAVVSPVGVALHLLRASSHEVSVEGSLPAVHPSLPDAHAHTDGAASSSPGHATPGVVDDAGSDGGAKAPSEPDDAASEGTTARPRPAPTPEKHPAPVRSGEALSPLTDGSLAAQVEALQSHLSALRSRTDDIVAAGMSPGASPRSSRSGSGGAAMPGGGAARGGGGVDGEVDVQRPGASGEADSSAAASPAEEPVAAVGGASTGKTLPPPVVLHESASTITCAAEPEPRAGGTAGRAESTGASEDGEEEDPRPPRSEAAPPVPGTPTGHTTPRAVPQRTPPSRRGPRTVPLPQSASPRPRQSSVTPGGPGGIREASGGERRRSVSARSPSHPLSPPGGLATGPRGHTPPRSYRVDDSGTARDAHDPYGFLSILVPPVQSMYSPEPHLSPRQKTLYKRKLAGYMQFERRELQAKQTYSRTNIANEYAEGMAKLRLRFERSLSRLCPKKFTVILTAQLADLVEDLEERAREDIVAFEAAGRRALTAERGGDGYWATRPTHEIRRELHRRWDTGAQEIRTAESTAILQLMTAFNRKQRCVDRLELCVATERTKRTFITALERVTHDAGCRERAHQLRRLCCFQHAVHGLLLPQEQHTRRLLASCEALDRRHIQHAFDTFAAVRRHAPHRMLTMRDRLSTAPLLSALYAKLGQMMLGSPASPAARPQSPEHPRGAMQHRTVTPVRPPYVVSLPVEPSPHRPEPAPAVHPQAPHRAATPAADDTSTAPPALVLEAPVHGEHPGCSGAVAGGAEESCPHGFPQHAANTRGGGRTVALEAVIPPEICPTDGEEVITPAMVELDPRNTARLRQLYDLVRANYSDGLGDVVRAESTSTPDRLESGVGEEVEETEEVEERCELEPELGVVEDTVPDGIRDVYHSALHGLLSDMRFALEAAESLERDRVHVAWESLHNDIHACEVAARHLRLTTKSLVDDERHHRAAIERDFRDARAEACGAFLLEQFCCMTVDMHIRAMAEAMRLSGHLKELNAWRYREHERLMTIDDACEKWRSEIESEEHTAWEEILDVFALFSQRFSFEHKLRMAVDTQVKERRSIEWHEVALRNALRQYHDDFIAQEAAKVQLREAIDREEEVYTTPAVRDVSPDPPRALPAALASPPPATATPGPPSAARRGLRPPRSPATEGEVRGLMSRLSIAAQQLRGKVEARAGSASCNPPLSPNEWLSPQSACESQATPPPPPFMPPPTLPPAQEQRALRLFRDVEEFYDADMFPMHLNDAFGALAEAVHDRHALSAGEEATLFRLADDLLTALREGHGPRGGATQAHRKLHSLLTLLQIEEDRRI